MLVLWINANQRIEPFSQQLANSLQEVDRASGSKLPKELPGKIPPLACFARPLATAVPAAGCSPRRFPAWERSGMTLLQASSKPKCSALMSMAR